MQDPAFIRNMIEQAAAAADNAEEAFGALHPLQWHWKPQAAAWSIAECLDHVITANLLYSRELKTIAEGTHQMRFWTRYNPLRGLFGRMLVSQIGEVPRRKYIAPAVFTPQTNPADGTLLERFSKHLDTIQEYMASFRQADVDKIQIVSPASRFVTYSLRHGLKLIIQHTYRHINQGIAVKQHKEFPA